MQVVKATFAWLYHFTVKQRSHQESILHKFEQNYPKSEIDESLDPINILLLDGGGMKGASLLASTVVLHDTCLMLGQKSIMPLPFT